MYRLAKSGYNVCGLDLNRAAVEFCNRRLVRHGFPQSAFVADMCDFQLPYKVQGAFNTVSSFRHVIGFDRARQHLKCMAKAIEPGGVYVLGFQLTPTQGEACEEERWSASRGHLTINCEMHLIDRDWDKALENYQLRFHIYTPTNIETC